MHVARHNGLRDVESHERSGLPPVDRGLRIGRSADPQKHQEGRYCGHGAAVHRELQKARTGDSRRFHRRAPGRDCREPPQDHRFRQAPRQRNHSGVDRAPLPGHRILRLRQEERPDYDRLHDRRGGPSASDRDLPGARPGGAGRLGGAFLRRVLFQAARHLARCAQSDLRFDRTETADEGGARVHGAPRQAQEVRHRYQAGGYLRQRRRLGSDLFKTMRKLTEDMGQADSLPVGTLSVCPTVLEARKSGQSPLHLKTVIMTLVVIWSSVLGNFALARGMRQAAPDALGSPLGYISVLFDPWVASGVTLLVVWLLSQMLLLSWAD